MSDFRAPASATKIGPARSSKSVWAATLLLGLALGCVTGTLAPYNLPEQPIALVHWEAGEAKKRAKYFEKAAEQPTAPAPHDPSDRADDRDIRAYLRGDESTAVQETASDHRGLLMLYWPRTGELERVEAAPRGSVPLAWSDDRRRLLFASDFRDDREQLYEYDLDRKELAPITFGRVEHPRGDYAGQGRFLVQQLRDLNRGAGSEGTIHFRGLGGQLGPVLGRDVPPGMLRVGPDGDFVVYEQVRRIEHPRSATIFQSMIAIRSLGDGAHAADDDETILAKGREPSLTPDGQWIVFASQSSAGYRLRRMRLDGSSKVAIGPGGTEERMPTVSPDGEFIAFIQDVAGQRKLSVRSFDGKKERVLLSKGWSEFPVW